MAADKEEALATAKSSASSKVTKKPPVNRSKLGPEYIAPDGGHGWLVALGAGCSNVSDSGERSIAKCTSAINPRVVFTLFPQWVLVSLIVVSMGQFSRK